MTQERTAQEGGQGGNRRRAPGHTPRLAHVSAFAAVFALLAATTPEALARGPEKKRAPEAKKPEEPKPAPAPPAPPPETRGVDLKQDRPPPEKRRMVGILDVRVDGVADDLKAKFEKDLEQQLDTNQYWLSTRAQMRDRMKFSTKWTEGCLVGDCLAEVRTQTNAELVLLAALTGSGTSFGYVVTLVRTNNGRVLAQDSGRCDVCTVNEAMAEATLATIRLLNDVPVTLPDEAGDQSAAIEVAVGASRRALARSVRHTHRGGIALTVTGLAIAVGAGAAYAVLDHPAWALATAAGGAGLAAGGVVVLTF